MNVGRLWERTRSPFMRKEELDGVNGSKPASEELGRDFVCNRE